MTRRKSLVDKENRCSGRKAPDRAADMEKTLVRSDCANENNSSDDFANLPFRSTNNKEDQQISALVDLPPRLFATDRTLVEGRINSYSNPDYLLDIAKVLKGSTELEWLMQNGFGRLFELPTRKCSLSRKLVHQFLYRSLVVKKKHEMWFVYGGYPIRFSLCEFALLTGLNCDPFPSMARLKQMQTPKDGDEDYWYELLGHKEAYTV